MQRSNFFGVKKNVLLLIIFLIVALVVSLFFLKFREKTEIKNNFIETKPTTEPLERVEYYYPIAEFRERIVKKSFGVYITPQDSPVQPERFKGYHAGVDVEYEDIGVDVPVFAVCDGEIVLSKWVSGYGGALILKCRENYYLYGHLNVDSIVKKTEVLKGEQIAILGKGNTSQTDNERKHLHFSINKKSADLRGYVQNKSELYDWENPLDTGIYKQ